MNRPACRLSTLASDGAHSVEFCAGCNVFHLKIGYTTLHLNPEAFAALCGIAAAGLARFRRQSGQAHKEQGLEDLHSPKGALH
jgi:hypothetical protein